MKQAYKIQGLRLQARMTAAILAAAGFCTGAWAENKLKINDVNIQPGGTATVVVNLENEDNLMATMQMDIVMPKGNTLDEESVVFTGNRLDINDFDLLVNKLDDTEEDVYRIAVLPIEAINFEGNSGALLQFNIKAPSNLTKPQSIEVRGIVGSDTDAKKYNMSPITVHVAPLVGAVSATSDGADSLLVRPAVEGDRQRVSVSLDNSVKVTDMEAVITLPEGLDFDLNKQGKVLIERGTRVPTNMKIQTPTIIAPGKAKVVLTCGLNTDVLKGESGEVFAFYVKGTEALAERSELTVSDVVVSDKAGNGFQIYEAQKVKVVNMDKAYLQPAQAIVTALTDSLAKATETIAQECPSVKDSAVVTEAHAAIKTLIAALGDSVKAAYTDGTLASDYNNKVAPKAEIEAAIDAMIEAAKKAQEDFETTEALNAAYAQATEALTALNDTLAKVMLDIEANCPDVKDSTLVTEAKAAIDAQVAVLSKAIEDAKADGSLTANIETILAPKAEIEAAIAKMTEDAKKAQKDFETEQALNAAYAQAIEVLGALNTAYTQAVEDINTNCPDVKESEAVLAAQTAVKEQLDAATKAVDDAKADGTLIDKKDELLDKKAEIEAAITKMTEDAQKAQKDFETEQALNAAYAQAQEVLSALNDTLAKVMLDIEANCPDVKESEAVLAAQTAVKEQLDAATKAVDDAKADGTLIDKKDELLAKKAEIEAAIAKMTEDAKKAQKDFETEQALNAAYAQAQEVLSALNAAYAQAVEDIDTNCPDVKESEAVLAAQTAVKEQLDAATKAVDDAKADGTLIDKKDELLAKKAEIEAAITKMTEDAQKAQKDFETEQALNAAYAQAQEVLSALNAAYAQAVEDINTNCPDVKESEAVLAAQTAVKGQLDAATKAVDDAKADGTLIDKKDELLAKKAEIEAAITKMTEAAQKAQKDFETEQALNAAYAQAQEVLNALNQKLENAIEAIGAFCPDVKDSTLVSDAKADIETQIAALSEAVEAAKADGSLTANTETVLAPKTDIEAAITKMVEDARKAQHDIDTGIDTTYGQEEIDAVFTLAGVRIPHIIKGQTCIIRYKNGSTKKIMVK